MNLHINLTTIPHPDDLLARRCDVYQSTHVCTPEQLVATVTAFLQRANQADLWKDRGSMVFMIQPIITPPGN